MIETEKLQTEKGYIKLFKNTRGYNHEIKLFQGSDTEEYKKLVDQLEEINNILLTKFTEA